MGRRADIRRPFFLIFEEFQMDLKIVDKVALVTGGSSGIGKAICIKLAEEGARVGVNYLVDEEKGLDFTEEARAVVAGIETAGGTAVPVRGDVSKEAEAIALFDQCEEAFGARVEILVNNAAVVSTAWISDYTVEQWEREFSINVTGVFILCREFIKRLDSDGRAGRIVNIASQAAFLGSTTGHLPYDSSKGAVVSMTRAIARETAERGYNVNSVAPGMVMTEMVAKTWEEKKDRYLSKMPMKRIAQPEEIASVVAFLASEVSSYMTGTCTDLTGGMLMR